VAASSGPIPKAPGSAGGYLLEKVLSSYGKDASFAREKLRNYLDLLASAGKTDEQLLAFGTEYTPFTSQPENPWG
jgi:hypothetical protein